MATVVHYIKQKYETVKASALGARDLNTIKWTLTINDFHCIL